MSTTASIDPRRATQALAAAMRGLQTRFEVAADNLSNLETTGHKRLIARSQGSSTESFQAELDSATAQPGLVRDFTQGDLIPNDNPADLALRGDGFFAVERDGQTRYVRAAQVQVAPDGTLLDGCGGTLLGDGGPLRLPEPGARWQVATDGTVSAAGQEVGKLRVVAFVEPQKLTAIGQGTWLAPDGAEIVAAGTTEVVQSSRERSNVDALHELVELIAIQRQHESAARALALESELRDRLNQELN